MSKELNEKLENPSEGMGLKQHIEAVFGITPNNQIATEEPEDLPREESDLEKGLADETDFKDIDNSEKDYE